MTEKFIWSCEDSERVEAGEPCRNPYGCHCREITELVRERDRLEETVSTLNTRAERTG